MDRTLVNETITTHVRFAREGKVYPIAFTWQERIYYVAGLGRQWTETINNIEWHCFMVQTRTGDTVQLCWNRQTNEWRLLAAWWRQGIA